MRWARGVALALLSEGGQPEEEEEEESSCEQGLGPERATAAAGTPSSSYSSSSCQTSLTWGADMFEGWDLRGRPTAGG